MPYIWADTLAAAERAHVLRLLVWGAASVLAGSALIAWMRVGQKTSALLLHFAIQTAAWGGVCVLIALPMLGGISYRDIAGATRLDRFLWLNIGLDAGYVMVGVTLAIAGWKLAGRLGLVGAGIGIVVQGLALALLDLVLATQISR